MVTPISNLVITIATIEKLVLLKDELSIYLELC